MSAKAMTQMSMFQRTFAKVSQALLVGTLLACAVVTNVAQAGEENSPSSSSFQALKSPLLNRHVFEDPLVPLGPRTEVQDQAMEEAVESYLAQNDLTDLSVFERFLANQPESPWRISLLTDLGLAYYHYGQFSGALSAWNAAWEEGKGVTDPGFKPVVDRAVGELIRMHARLGHVDDLHRLLNEVEGRPVVGSAAEAIAGAKQGLWLMENEPGFAYLCGPVALRNLVIWDEAHPLNATPVPKHGDPFEQIAKYRSNPKGVTLLELTKLAADIGVDVVPVRRLDSAQIPLPAIVHWKVNHYAAIVEKEGNRYHIKDSTFGTDLWISQHALETESSGYFLLSRNDARQPGWQIVSEAEASEVYGRGNTQTVVGTETLPYSPKCDCKANRPPGPAKPGMPVYDAHSLVVSLNIVDTPLSYKPALGPAIDFTITYNQREATQPTVFNYFNLGTDWNFNWLTYIQDDPTQPGISVTRYVAGGGGIAYTGYSSTAKTFAPDRHDGSVLVAGSGYTLNFNDGSKAVFGASDGSTVFPRHFFLSQIVDPAGNAVKLTYDGSMRVTSITDAAGNVSTLKYGLTSAPLLLTEIDDPFGRSALLNYDSQGRLSSIQDAIGMVSSFGYNTGTFIQSMNTPYGTSNFTYGENGIQRYLQMTDPLNETERVEFTQNATGLPFSEVLVPNGISPFNAYINYRNTFHWDSHQFAVGAGDYTKASITHWLHNADNTTVTDGAIESVKGPLENRIWYNYPGQSNVIANGTLNYPSAIGQVLDDGVTTTLTKITYTSTGLKTTETDPVGRELAYDYAANGIDLLDVKQLHGQGFDTLGSYTYNTQHEPLTYTDANGNVWHMTYNSFGQPLTVTDPLSEVTTYAYNTKHQLSTITDGNNIVVKTFAYDAVGRVSSVTDQQGYVVNYAYDNLDRLTTTTYPDATTDVLTWTKLDVTSSKNRIGQVTSYAFSARRELLTVTDPANDVITYGYDEYRRMVSQKDGNNNLTTWSRDLEGRVTAKIDPAGKSTNMVYGAATGWLTSITDALGQTKTMTYAPDAKTTLVHYSNSVVPTADVRFSWDPAYPRLVSMTDGTGTTGYQYASLANGPLGSSNLLTITSPYANANIQRTYDALGRVSQRSIDQATDAFIWDKAGRLTNHNSPLGHEVVGYLGETTQVSGITWSDHSFTTAFTYLPNSGDRRLSTIKYAGQVPETLTYTTTSINRITQIADLYGGATLTKQYGYDSAERLTSEVYSDGGLQNMKFDSASNMTSQLGSYRNQLLAPNDLNQVAERTVPSTVTGNGASSLDADYTSRRYTWDAEHRLVQILYYGSTGGLTGASTTFGYDGLGHRVSITEQGAPVGGVPPSPIVTHFLWCGDALCQERDSSDNVIATYYDEGVVQGSGGTGRQLYYTKDHLGSVLSLLDTNGALVSRNRYDAWGNPTVAPIGAASALPLAFAGQYYHAASGLYLAEYRAYDSSSGRWLSRDPLEEGGGINLYAYAYGNPVRLRDPSGRFGVVGFGIGVVAGGIAGYAAGGWYGAAAGGLVGGAVGIVAPEFSSWAGGAAAGAMGLGDGAAAILTTGAFVASNSAGGVGATMMGNLVNGGSDIWEGTAYGAVVGGLAPLMSGEAFFIGAGGEEAFGAWAANGFASGSGMFAWIGAMTDPNAWNGFRGREAHCSPYNFDFFFPYSPPTVYGPNPFSQLH